MLQPHPGADDARWRRPSLLPASLAVLSFLLPSPSVSAQAEADEIDQLRAELRAALAVIAELEGRVLDLETERTLEAAEADLEAQLQALVIAEPTAPPRTVFPSATNPRVGVFVTALAEAGNAEERLGTDGDRFSLKETEIDIRLPISPFAEGVLITAFEDGGSGEFETHIEEGYSDIALGALTGGDTLAKLKVGRFRQAFGSSNRLHRHDLPQVDRPYASTAILGEEGLIGDGVEATFPLYQTGGLPGEGAATTASVAVVNGEMLTGEHGLLGELAEDAGLELDSDAPMFVARLSHFTELTAQSDAEFGASFFDEIGSNAVRTDAGSKINASAAGLDATVRIRDDESGQNSWLFNAEAIRSDYEFSASGAPGFPDGNDRSDGYWITAQRQISPRTYVGLRVGEADVLGTNGAESITDYSPYITWYADEFFRFRLQGQHLDVDSAGGSTSVDRLFLESTWNFGAHQPHPYWTNR